jgi:hypothetical protein
MVDGPPLVFLSPAWAAALAEAAAADPAVAAAAPPAGALVRHEVTAVPPDGRTVAYAVRAGPDGSTTVHLDADADADVDVDVDADVDAGPPLAAFTAAYGDAADVLLGRTNAQRLVADGRLRVVGDLAALADLAPWLEALARAWAPVRARTVPA